jgi:serine/threonine protein kinase
LGQIAAQSHFEERYELRGTLAHGGMGQIYRAYDRILRREVAIKMMREKVGSDTPAIRGQFLKEARVGGRLLHPHILAVFDLGVNRSG